MFFKKKRATETQGYKYRPRQFDRDEKIEIQKIVSNIPVTQKLLSQELLVTAINNFVVKNIKIGSTAAHHINTTKHPQLFFQSVEELISSTENLQKLEPYWRFEGHTPTEQLEDFVSRRDKIIKGFIYESFTQLVEELEKKKSPSAKQRLFDEYQASLLNKLDVCGEENFEFFKTLCREKLNISE
ncbi:MAG: hypothetical protein J6Q83_05805 [Clostridia bacterium]|nr:hypothetical protein [Clostridia bacterium]